MTAAKELAFLLDITGSMNDDITKRSRVKRKQVSHDASKIFIGKLAELDSAGEEEEGGGGVLTFAFSLSAHQPQGFFTMGDLNANNFEDQWAQLHFRGSTYIMPALDAALSAYQEEFADADPAPDYVLLVMTDGALDDEDKFEKRLLSLGSNMSVQIVLFGEGDDTKGVPETYQRLASRSNGKVKVHNLVGVSDAETIANRLFQSVLG